MIQKWLTTVKKVVYKTPIFSLTQVNRRHLERDQEANFYTVDSPDWINVIAVTEEDEVVLVRQYRHGLDEITLEIPGGLVDEGEQPLHAAKRELLEETGFSSDDWQCLGQVSANPAFMTNRCTTFLALNAKRTHEQAFDEHEELEIVLHPAQTFHTLIDTNQIHHSIVISAAYFWSRYQQTQALKTV